MNSKREDKAVAEFTIQNHVIIGSHNPVIDSVSKIGMAIFDEFNKYPDHVAQIDTDSEKKTTFGEMKDLSVRCALWLESQILEPDDIVIVCTHNRSDMYIPIFATFFVEAIYSAWDHEMTIHSARYLVNLFKPKIIFTCESALSVLREASRLENVDTRYIVFEDHPDELSLNQILRRQSREEAENYVPRNRRGPRDVAAILLSSGSTGFPKGVMFSSEALVKNFGLDVLSIGGKIFSWYSTLSWLSGILFLMNTVLFRATRILHPCTSIEVEDICRDVEKFKINSLFLSPIVITNLAKSDAIKRYNLKSMERIYTGGSKTSKEAMKILQTAIPSLTIIQGYGMTELGRLTHVQTTKRSSFDSLGVSTWDVQSKIVDRVNGNTLGPNACGELLVKTPGMMFGYYKNPKETEETIDSEGWLHTGDLCYYDNSGEFFLVDRLKEMMKFRNHQVTPNEIEDILLTHPSVMEVAVVPVPHELDGERPMAFVKLVQGREVSKEELIELSSLLGKNKKLWGGVEFLDDLPKTASEKIARCQLKELAKSLTESLKS